VTARARGWLAALILVAGASARAGELDRSKYVEVPGLTHPTISTLAVAPDEPAISAETRARHAGRRPSGDYTLFYNTNGTVDGVDVDRSIPGCDDFIVGKLRTAQMMPHPLKPVRRHMTIELSFHSPDQAGPPRALRAKNVSPHEFETQQVAAPIPHLPDAVKAKHASGPDLTWMGKVCVQGDGTVDQVSVLSGIPGADDAIVTTLRTWRLRPQVQPICSMVRFVFALEPPQRGKRP
jgi:hypothetical protein